jgi:gliding motility-associated-like protein
VQDAAGCLATLTVVISQPAALTFTPSFLPPTCNGASNATITANASGGTAPYLYSLNTGANQASTVFTGNIPSGTYTLTVTDNNSCTATSSVGVTQPNPLLISTISTASILCFGGNNGFINTSVSGGTPIYNYSWVSSSTVTPGNNALATNLTSGGYTLSVTDLQGCSTSTVYNVSQPLPLVVLGSSVNSASCGLANGSATVTIGGGISSQPYNYLWNTLTSQTTNIATGLNGGVWTLTITDGNGCTITESVTITAPPAPTATLGFTPPLCFGQNNASAWITATGTGPFTYSWSPLSLTTGTINGIGAGAYTATVTDFYGCKTNGIVNVTQPNLLILNVSAPDTICYGQNAQINTSASGGTSPYNYYWSSASSVITGTIGGPYSITPTVNSNYTVSATDANGCIVSPTIIYVKVKPQLIAKGFSVTACDKDLITLSPVITSSGSGGPYTYNWSNTMMGSSITVPARFSPINPNVYSVTISDGCTVPNTVANFTIDVKPSPTGSFTSNVKSGCAPLLVNFIASSTGVNDKFIWNFYSAGNAIGNEPQQYINYTNAGVYNVGIKITNTFGCKRDTIIPNYIIVYPSPIADFELVPKEVNLFDPSFTFINTSQGASSFFWDFGDYSSNSNTSVIINPKHTYENIGVYDVHLVASNLYGCKDTLKKQVEVKLDVGIYFPNAFTPDGDNLNEEFKPKGYGIKSEPYKLEIFDRWGIELFSSENFSKGWDGTVKGTNIIAEEGIYVYKCFLTDFGGNKKYFVGHVTLLK